MTRAPLCAKCHHLKSRHRTRECRQTWQGVLTITKWCTCDGYQPPASKTKERTDE